MNKSFLVGKSEEKIPIGRPRRRSQDNIRIDLTELGREVDWIHISDGLWRKRQ